MPLSGVTVNASVKLWETKKFEGTEPKKDDSYEYSTSVRPAMTPEMRSVFSSLVNILSPKGGVLLEADSNEGEDVSLEKYDAGELDES